MKQIYISPSIMLIECMPECMQSYSGVKDMEDTSVFNEDLDDDLIV